MLALSALLWYVHGSPTRPISLVGLCMTSLLVEVEVACRPACIC